MKTLQPAAPELHCTPTSSPSRGGMRSTSSVNVHWLKMEVESKHQYNSVHSSVSTSCTGEEFPDLILSHDRYTGVDGVN